jgi:hypothetical protein
MTGERRPFDPSSDEDFAALPTEPIHEVVPGLLQADADLTPEDAWARGVNVLVNVAGWMKEPVKVPLGHLYVAWRFEDDPEELPDTGLLRGLARLLADRVRSGETVAVYCAGGLNRSGLVVAQTLIELGFSPTAAIELIRAARGKWALSNPAFETFLLSQEQ